jgi:hypothetical protein
MANHLSMANIQAIAALHRSDQTNSNSRTQQADRNDATSPIQSDKVHAVRPNPMADQCKLKRECDDTDRRKRDAQPFRVGAGENGLATTGRAEKRKLT